MSIKPATLHTMAEVAEKVHKSVRWLQEHLRDHPHGRFVGRSRLFTDDDVDGLVNSFNADALLTIRQKPAKVVEDSDYDAAMALLEDLRIARRPDKDGFIYFIAAGASVKIGFASDVAGRLAALQIGNHEKLILLHVEPGSMQDEARFHARFADLRTRGEWFSCRDDVATYIEEQQ